MAFVQYTCRKKREKEREREREREFEHILALLYNLYTIRASP
jgi:hypothetical protein